MQNSIISRNYQLNLSVGSSVDIFDKNFTLLSIHKDVVFVVGGVPIWIRANFNIDGQVSANASASMDITHQYTKTSTYNAIIEYKNSAWDYIYNKSDNISTDNSFSVTGDLTQKFDIGPNITFKIYGIIGPYIDARLTEELKLCAYNDNWKGNIDIGGELSVGAKAEVLGTTLFDVSKTWSQGFYNVQFPYRLEMISGNNQTYNLGEELAKPVKVKVKSNKGFTIPGAIVHFEPKNGGSVANNTVFADINGFAQTTWTPGAVNNSMLDAYILDCDGNNINNSPIMFNATELGAEDCEQSSLSVYVLEVGNTIKPVASMGNPPYTYSQDGINFYATPPVISPVPGETYLFMVRDNMGCYAAESYSTPNDICDNTEILITITTSGNVIEANAEGGTSPYLYSIDGGDFTSENIFTEVPIGSHIISVKDANQCSASSGAVIYEENAPIIAEFYTQQTSILLGSSVYFHDLSNNASTWQWDFGDGSFSSERNPTHTYSTAGTYTVSLTVSNAYGSDIEIKENFITVNLQSETVTDIDGNTYATVTIGNQTWMAENLKVTHYPNGDPIPLVTDNTAWGNLQGNNTDDAYCYYNNNANGEADTYGALYTYAAAIGDNWERDLVENQGVCPDGWHLPSDAEWKTLEMTLGMSQSEADNTGWRGTNQGSKLAGNADLWNNGALETNSEFGSSGFTALPGGYRGSSGSFYGVGNGGYWWSATENGSSYAYYRRLYYDSSEVDRDSNLKSYGFSVRCLRD